MVYYLASVIEDNLFNRPRRDIMEDVAYQLVGIFTGLFKEPIILIIILGPALVIATYYIIEAMSGEDLPTNHMIPRVGGKKGAGTSDDNGNPDHDLYASDRPGGGPDHVGAMIASVHAAEAAEQSGDGDGNNEGGALMPLFDMYNERNADGTRAFDLDTDGDGIPNAVDDRPNDPF